MAINLILSTIFLVLLGLTMLSSRYFKAGYSEAPNMYSYDFVKGIINLSAILFFILSIFIIFFYSWKLFLLLLIVGFATEAFIIIPLIERVLYQLTKMIIKK